VTIVGAPLDLGQGRRGVDMGPSAIRYAGLEERLASFGCAVVDRGNLATPEPEALAVGDERARFLAEILDACAGLAELVAGVVADAALPLVLGGDHSIVLGELRAHAAVRGPLAVVLLDAHADTWEAYYGERYFHGTPFKRALEEGLIDPHRSLLAGMRGPLYAASDLDEPRSWGFEIVPCDELRTWTPAEYGARVRERIGDGPAYLSFDIDVLDPAFAPGTGTPEIAGLLPHEAVAFLRALAGIRFTGFDVVEVSPPYDGPGQVTALTGASIAYELLALAAVAAAAR